MVQRSILDGSSTIQTPQRVGSVDEGKIEEDAVSIASRLTAWPVLFGIAFTDFERDRVLLAV